MTKKLLALVILGHFALVACGQGPETSVNETGGDAGIVDGNNITPVLLLKNMDSEQISAVAEACPDDSSEEACMVICHIPQGELHRAKTIMIPITAIETYATAATNKQRHHDFAGNCNQLPHLDVDSSENGISDGSYFCDAGLTNDLDCDGQDDLTLETIK